MDLHRFWDGVITSSSNFTRLRNDATALRSAQEFQRSQPNELVSTELSRKAYAQEKYSAFVQAGIGNPSIWESLQAQSLLGVEGFAEGLRHLVVEKQQIREIPKGQRFVGRPSLEKLFSTRSPGKASRNRLVAEAITAHGYSEMEVASFLGLHYSTISRILTTDKRANIKT
jgi:hypothetical protein